jgi:hypothetical protein
MAARSNACSELTRFWLEARHGFLVTESVPVPVPYGLSDLDLVAMHPAQKSTLLFDGRVIGPHLVIETKDEHDFDPAGSDFGKLLRRDVEKFGGEKFIPEGTPGPVKFSMLREAHHEVACQLFGSDEYDRVFVVHAIDPLVLNDLESFFDAHRIYWLTIRDVVRDLREWYQTYPRPVGLRHSLVGDILHLLVGYCGLDLPNV